MTSLRSAGWRLIGSLGRFLTRSLTPRAHVRTLALRLGDEEDAGRAPLAVQVSRHELAAFVNAMHRLAGRRRSFMTGAALRLFAPGHDLEARFRRLAPDHQAAVERDLLAQAEQVLATVSTARRVDRSTRLLLRLVLVLNRVLAAPRQLVLLAIDMHDERSEVRGPLLVTRAQLEAFQHATETRPPVAHVGCARALFARAIVSRNVATGFDAASPRLRTAVVAELVRCVANALWLARFQAPRRTRSFDTHPHSRRPHGHS